MSIVPVISRCKVRAVGLSSLSSEPGSARPNKTPLSCGRVSPDQTRVAAQERAGWGEAPKLKLILPLAINS